jgi:nitrogen fixation protein FixH
MKTYTSNTLINLAVVILDQDSNPVDPTTLTAKVKAPDNSITDISINIVKDGNGNYHAPYFPTLQGIYTYEFVATGSVEVAVVDKFLVNPVVF